jgi:hypothetical protein
MSFAAQAGVYDTFYQEDWDTPWNTWFVTILVFQVGAVVGFILHVASVALPVKKDLRKYVTSMRWFGGIIVFIALYRSFYQVQYISYFVYWDSWLNNGLIWRCTACVSNLCWITQVCYAVIWFDYQMTLDEWPAWSASTDVYFGPGLGLPGCFGARDGAGRQTRWMQICMRAAFIAVCISEIFSFAGAISQSFLWFGIAAGLWAFVFLVSFPCFWEIYKQVRKLRLEEGSNPFWISFRQDKTPCDAEVFGLLFSIFSAAAFLWICFVEIPADVHLYQDQQSVEFMYVSFGDGLSDLANQRHFTLSTSVWTATVFQRIGCMLVGTSMTGLFMAMGPRNHYELLWEDLGAHQNEEEGGCCGPREGEERRGCGYGCVIS